MSFHVGQIVGDYRIVAIVGIGGMGEVYKVEHVITRRVEAMKVLGQGFSEEQSNRFLREIQVQASLNHPNIAAVHTAFRFGENLALVMEFLEGKSLGRILKTTRAPLPTMIAYMNQVLSALEYAHERGVIHRDVSPGNIIVTNHGVIKLTDFGLAKRVSDARVSQSGAFIGSPHYMSPEQARGGAPSDARSDIYSAGAVLYELVTGRKLFESSSVFELLSAHVNQQPVAPIELEPKVPRALNDVILKALAKDPAARFQSAREFRMALKSSYGSQDGAKAAVSRVRPLWHNERLRQVVLGVVSAFTVACAGTWWYVRSPAPHAAVHPAPRVVELPRSAPSVQSQLPAEIPSKPTPERPATARRAPPAPAAEPEAEPPAQDPAPPAKEPSKLRRVFGRILHPLKGQ